eukprot:scaffold276877_cov17-Tisochrysis_lutea.AAC.2
MPCNLGGQPSSLADHQNGAKGAASSVRLSALSLKSFDFRTIFAAPSIRFNDAINFPPAMSGCVHNHCLDLHEEVSGKKVASFAVTGNIPDGSRVSLNTVTHHQKLNWTTLQALL